MSTIPGNRLRYLGLALALSLGFIGSNAYADSGNVNAIPQNQWVFFVPQQCFYGPWDRTNNNRETLILYPNASDQGKYIWTTDDPLISALSLTCKAGGGFWVYSSDNFFGVAQRPGE